MKIIDKYGDSVQFPASLHILVVFDSLYEKKSFVPHDHLLKWKDAFQELKIPVYVISPDDRYHVAHSSFHYVYNMDRSLYIKYDLIRTKYVFGKEYHLIYPCMLLMDGTQVITKTYRLNERGIGQVYLKALRIRYMQKKEKIERMLKEYPRKEDQELS